MRVSIYLHLRRAPRTGHREQQQRTHAQRLPTATAHTALHIPRSPIPLATPRAAGVQYAVRATAAAAAAAGGLYPGILGRDDMLLFVFAFISSHRWWSLPSCDKELLNLFKVPAPCLRYQKPHE